MTDELVVVGVAAGRIEAEILLGYLRARGIECILSQEAATSAYGLTVGEFGRVEILALGTQSREAVQIIDQYYSNQTDSES